MHILQKHIPTLLLYLAIIPGSFSCVAEPQKDPIRLGELQTLDMPEDSPKEQDKKPAEEGSTNSIIKPIPPTPLKALQAFKATPKTSPYIPLYIAALLWTAICILLIIILRKQQKQKRQAQLSGEVHIAISTYNPEQHILELENDPEQHALHGSQLDPNTAVQQAKQPLQFCGYDAQYLLSLSEDTPAWNAITQQVIETSPLITQRGINSIGDCIFKTFYDTKTIALHCELLQAPKGRTEPSSPSTKRDAEKILEQLEKERTKLRNHVFQQEILDLVHKHAKETTEKNAEEPFTKSLLNRMEACKLAYRMMQCFPAKVESALPSNDKSFATEPIPTSEMVSPTPYLTSAADTSTPLSATTQGQEEGARKVALKLRQVFHSKEATFVKEFKAGIQESAVTMDFSNPEEQSIASITSTDIVKQVSSQLEQAITKARAQTPEKTPSRHTKSTKGINDLIQDRLEAALKQMLVQAFLQVLTQVPQTSKAGRRHAFKQGLDSS